MRYKCIAGLDPGISGAIAFYFPDQPKIISAYDIPSVNKEINASELYDLIKKYDPDLIVVEHVHAFRGQGVSSSFNFGNHFGVAKGVIGSAKVPMHFVSPGKWKRHFGLTADKEQARALAISTWPFSEHFRRKKDNGRAEAALLALYGARIQL